MDIMMMNGDGGPFMSGTWYNPNTGDSFTVRDTYFEDNNLIVMTTDGRRLNYDIVSKYVKSDKPLQKQPNLAQQQVSKPAQTDLPKEIQDMISEDPGINFGNPKDVVPTYPQSVAVTGIHEDENGIMHEVEDEDAMLVRRMMKRASTPEIDCKIKWNNFPSKQLEMLEMMGVDEEKIAEFVMKSFDLKTIQEQIKKSIIEYINNPVLHKTEVINPVQKDEPSKVVAAHQENNANTTTKKPDIVVTNKTTVKKKPAKK